MLFYFPLLQFYTIPVAFIVYMVIMHRSNTHIDHPLRCDTRWTIADSYIASDTHEAVRTFQIVTEVTIDVTTTYTDEMGGYV